MADEKKPRRQRRNFAEERAQLVMFCNLSIQILGPMTEVTEGEHGAHAEGQIAALTAVLGLLGEKKMELAQLKAHTGEINVSVR